MTRNEKSAAAYRSSKQGRRARKQRRGHWILQDAKARFSELVRRARSEGPQHVTVHGRDEVVVISAEQYHLLKGDRTGAALIAAMQSSPHRQISLEPERYPLPVRDVNLP
jgi:prevent-host-death family protein